MSTEKSTSRDRLRAKALQSRPTGKKIVEFDGERYEVRAPSFGLQDRVSAEAISVIRNGKGKVVDRRPNPMKGAALMIIYSVFSPEDGEPVFEKTDLETIMAAPLDDGGFIATISDAMKALTKGVPTVEEEMGNSDASPSGASS